MIRGKKNSWRFGGPAALLLAACLLAGCETSAPDWAGNSAAPLHQASMAHAVRHHTGQRTARLLQAAIQTHRLHAPAGRRKVPAIVPRPRELPQAPSSEVQTAAPETGAAMPAQFEWPVEGKVLLAFGPGGRGERNDGINIEAEPGTPIHAAAAGEVTYAGKLKGYGDLILLRHRSGYVTAYAHAQAIMVSVGDRVDRGEVIGLSDKSGDVDAPQLHFEIRQGVKPLDPKPLLMASRES